MKWFGKAQEWQTDLLWYANFDQQVGVLWNIAWEELWGLVKGDYLVYW